MERSNEKRTQTSTFFTYQFDEDLDRIYSCFIDPSIFFGIIVKKFVKDMHFNKAKYLDEPNQLLVMTVEKLGKTTFLIGNEGFKNNEIKRYYHKAILFEGMEDSNIYLYYTFIRNTTEHNTLFMNEIVGVSNVNAVREFLTVFSYEEKKKGCENLCQYLRSSSIYLTQTESILIDASSLKVFDALKRSNNFLSQILYCDKNIETEINVQGGFNTPGTIFTINQVNNPNKILMSFKLCNYFHNNEKIKFLLQSQKTKDKPYENITIVIESLSPNHSYLFVKHIFLEYKSNKYIWDIGKKKRKILRNFKEHLKDWQREAIFSMYSSELND